MSRCVFLFLAVSHLCEAAPGPLDGDLALVVDGGPDVDGLAGHVAAAVQAHAARDRARGQARHAQLVLDLAVERLLKKYLDKTKIFRSNKNIYYLNHTKIFRFKHYLRRYIYLML